MKNIYKIMVRKMLLKVFIHILYKFLKLNICTGKYHWYNKKSIIPHKNIPIWPEKKINRL